MSKTPATCRGQIIRLLFGWVGGGCAGAWLSLLLTTAVSLSAAEPLGPKVGERNVDGIMDNSFLVEEAYNQEKGVVQHIMTAFWALDHAPGAKDRWCRSCFHAGMAAVQSNPPA